MTLLLLLLVPLLLPLSTVAYNLEVKQKIIFTAPVSNDHSKRANDSYFGYSVLLYSRKNKLLNGSLINESWLLVGAPKANYALPTNRGNDHIPKEPGIAYRCRLPDQCVPINLSDPDDDLGFIDQVNRHTLIEKRHGWLGAAMSVCQHTDSLIVCAPRTIVKIYGPKGIDYDNTMHGFCYTGKTYDGNLKMEDKHLSTYNFNGSKFWWNPLNGFAVHYPTSKNQTSTDATEPIIGSPKHELYGSVHKMGHNDTVELPIGDDLTQFGYALSSGCYFHGMQLMVAAGAPGWQYVGQVAIMDPQADPPSIIVTMNGKEVGEFFGASLATGDMNNDGLEDLAVGAPHWNNDNGRVHIFFGNKAGFYEADILLEGKVDDALYGYALTSGDLDGDGFDDLIVGAPWEDSGVIYVYNGDANLREAAMIEPSQRITATDIDNDVRRFGFSLANVVDVNDDGFSDIAVGAYASGHVVLLKSKPAVKVVVKLETYPKTLHRNSTGFVLKVCLDHSPHSIVNKRLWDFRIQITVDEDYDRLVSYTRIYSNLRHSPGQCRNTSYVLQKNISNYLDVIQIVVDHSFYYSSLIDNCAKGILPMIRPCPIEYRARKVTARTELPFDIGCGHDNICHANIVMELDFRGVSNSTWIIGSDDLSLVMRIGNRLEPAYLTTVTFEVPRGINLRSIRPSCQEHEVSEIVRVTCDVGNPLGTLMEEVIVLDLDMTGLSNDATDGTVLNFNVDVKTRSNNTGISSMVIPLRLTANVSVDLSGKAYDNSYYTKHNEKPTNLSFQHAYQISRFGATPITAVLLTIRIPFKLNDSEFLTMREKPRIYVLGRGFECSVIGISVTKPRFVDDTPVATTIENFFHFNGMTNNSRVRRDETFPNNFASRLKTDETSRGTLTHTTRYKIDGDAQPQFSTVPGSENVDNIYLNCSTSDVTCGRVVCEIASLKGPQDVGKLKLRLVVDDSKLDDGSHGKENIIHITTEAYVRVLDTKMKNHIVPGAQIWVPVTTTLHRAPNLSNHVSIWIILGSVLLGLLALCLIARTLWKFGFFARNKKKELDRLKKSEDISMHSDSFGEQ